MLTDISSPPVSTVAEPPVEDAISHLAALTAHRDRELLDVSLAQGVLELLAVITTSISSGRGLMKSSRVRPSGSRPIVAGIVELVSTQPSGSTTALAGRPNARCQTSSSPARV